MLGARSAPPAATAILSEIGVFGLVAIVVAYAIAIAATLRRRRTLS